MHDNKMIIPEPVDDVEVHQALQPVGLPRVRAVHRQLAQSEAVQAEEGPGERVGREAGHQPAGATTHAGERQGLARKSDSFGIKPHDTIHKIS